LRLVDPPDGTPRAGRRRERALRFSEAPEELVVESGLGICVEGGRVPARRADAGGERRPQVVDRRKRLPRRAAPRGLGQDRPRPRAARGHPAWRPHDRAFAEPRRALRIERFSYLPEGSKHGHLARVVLYAAPHGGAAPCHPPHLGHGLSGIGHEVEDELGEHGIEGLVVEGKRLGAGDPYIRVRHPSAAGGLTRSDRLDARRARP
jgi:hypothetical protein